MSRLAILEDFENGEMYTEYKRYPFFSDRAREINGRFGSTKGAGKILVAGCGWGYLVEELLNLGYDAWGCDGSSYALGKAKTAISPEAFSRLKLANCKFRADMTAMRVFAGLTGGRKFSLCITEDMLTVCDHVAEVLSILSELRRVANTLFHILSPIQPELNQMKGLLWQTMDQWKVTIGGGEWLMNAVTGKVIIN